MTDSNQNTNAGVPSAPGSTAPEMWEPASDYAEHLDRVNPGWREDGSFVRFIEQRGYKVNDDGSVVKRAVIEKPAKDVEPESHDEGEHQETAKERQGEESPDAQPQTELQVPDIGLDSLRHAEVQAHLDAGLADIVKNAGMNADEVQSLVNHAVDMALADQSGVPLDDRAGNEAVIRHRWGADFDKNLAVVHGVVDRIPGLAEYLDKTQLGNSPAVLDAILQYGLGTTKLSPTEAQRQLDEMMKPGSPYARGDNAAVSKARVLANIVHGEKAKKSPAATTAMKPAPDPTSALATERRKLMESPAFLDTKHKEHAATMARYREVTERMYGGA